MSEPFVDTDVLIRLLTGDDPTKQADAAALFEQVQAGQVVLRAPGAVVADAVYVLSSPRLYRLPRQQIRDMLATLVRLPSLRVENRRAVLDALDVYAATKLDFGDALIVASMRLAGSELLYSYDRDFDRISGISSRGPGAAAKLQG